MRCVRVCARECFSVFVCVWPGGRQRGGQGEGLLILLFAVKRSMGSDIFEGKKTDVCANFEFSSADRFGVKIVWQTLRSLHANKVTIHFPRRICTRTFSSTNLWGFTVSHTPHVPSKEDSNAIAAMQWVAIIVTLVSCDLNPDGPEHMFRVGTNMLREGTAWQNHHDVELPPPSPIPRC
mmetsp:Transcript_30017/g.79157  ORF Transcript_30017/g.79157 Transcript_30017/m.79157 type:complete len:179 (-) Transcript_30017:257-793(-)